MHVVVMKLPVTSCHRCSLLHHLISFWRGMFKLKAKFDRDSLLYLLSHSEWDSHTVHMLTRGCLLPLLTSTVKLSLFTHVHSSPLSLAARLHQCHANHSHYINNGWTFSRQTLYFASFVFWNTLNRWHFSSPIMTKLINKTNSKDGGWYITFTQIETRLEEVIHIWRYFVELELPEKFYLVGRYSGKTTRRD